MNLMDIHKLFDLSYLLVTQPPYQFKFLIPFSILFGLCLIAGIILSVAKPLRSYYWSGPIAQWLRWFGFVGLIFTFFRNEGILYLGMRIWFYVLGLGFLIWLGYIIRDLRMVTPVSAEKAIRQSTYDKYLPRPKQQRRKV